MHTVIGKPYVIVSFDTAQVLFFFVGSSVFQTAARARSRLHGRHNIHIDKLLILEFAKDAPAENPEPVEVGKIRSHPLTW